MNLIEYAFLFFFLTITAKGFEMAIYQRKHVVSAWKTRERVQGRFTGATLYKGRLDDGREVDLDSPAYLVMAGSILSCFLAVVILTT